MLIIKSNICIIAVCRSIHRNNSSYHQHEGTAKYRKLYWIATESIGRKPDAIKGFEELVLGIITIEVDSGNVEEFRSHWNNLEPATESQKRNIWLKPFWEDYYKCRFSSSTVSHAKICPSKAKSNMSKIFSKIKQTIDAVYTFANALEDFRKEKPKHFPYKSDQPYPGDEFFNNYLSKVKLSGSKIFNDNGDFAHPKYTVYQYQLEYTETREPIPIDSHHKPSYKKVGVWFQNKLHFQTQNLKWPFKNKNEVKSAPTSSCDTDCGLGQVLETSGGVCCSGRCRLCEKYEYKVDANTCKDCNEYGNNTLDWMPTSDKKNCEPPGHKILTPISTFISMWGITFTSIVLYAFIQNIDTPIVKNSSKEHCIIILVGLLLIFFNACICEIPRTVFICYIIRFIAPLGFSMV